MTDTPPASNEHENNPPPPAQQNQYADNPPPPTPPAQHEKAPPSPEGKPVPWQEKTTSTISKHIPKSVKERFDKFDQKPERKKQGEKKDTERSDDDREDNRDYTPRRSRGSGRSSNKNNKGKKGRRAYSSASKGGYELPVQGMHRFGRAAGQLTMGTNGRGMFSGGIDYGQYSDAFYGMSPAPGGRGRPSSGLGDLGFRVNIGAYADPFKGMQQLARPNVKGLGLQSLGVGHLGRMRSPLAGMMKPMFGGTQPKGKGKGKKKGRGKSILDLW